MNAMKDYVQFGMTKFRVYGKSGVMIPDRFVSFKVPDENKSEVIALLWDDNGKLMKTSKAFEPKLGGWPEEWANELS